MKDTEDEVEAVGAAQLRSLGLLRLLTGSSQRKIGGRRHHR